MERLMEAGVRVHIPPEIVFKRKKRTEDTRGDPPTTE